ncbi:Leucine rich repeat variant [hydrothermal vent metagenome]|uniref:Leucine rich repeat variant n=1 Tax=hydrothermal vent metagenome TaxID=652676 RepID=A0A1W1EHT0_9ZZZZ
MLKELKNKKVLFLGRSTIFNDIEITNFLRDYNIEFSRDFSEYYDAIIEHRNINPVEEDISNDAYDRGVKIYKLHKLEEDMSRLLDDNSILMAIKLGGDMQRVDRLLSNEYITDELFIKLLNIYEWEESEFGDSTRDRDVFIHTLTRFLSIKRNERDLLYSPLSLLKLVKESRNRDLLLALISFPKVSFLQKDKSKVTIKELIAQTPYIDKKIIKKLLSFKDNNIDFFLASNSKVPLDILNLLSQKNIDDINKALASNISIDDNLFIKLLEKEPKILLTYQPINLERYKLIQKDYDNILSLNRLLTNDVIDILVSKNIVQIDENILLNDNISTDIISKIYNKNIDTLYPNIASNPSTPIEILEALYQLNNYDINISLSANTSTPNKILEELFSLDDLQITKGLATNKSLDIELLNILQLDTRFSNELTKNQKFIDSMNRSLQL